MKLKRMVLLLITLFVLAFAADPQGLTAGTAIENFSLPDLMGISRRLTGSKGRRERWLSFFRRSVR